MMFPSAEMWKGEGEQIWVWGRSGKHGYVKLEVSFKHLSGDIEVAIGYQEQRVWERVLVLKYKCHGHRHVFST